MVAYERVYSILLPIYNWWQLPYYYAGCKLYDVLAGKENMESAYWVGKGKALEAFPTLKKEGLVGGVVYYDGKPAFSMLLSFANYVVGQHNDSRMNISIMMTAVQHGAVVANYTEVTELHKKADPSRNGEERIYAATVKDNLTGKTMKVRCRVRRVSIFHGPCSSSHRVLSTLLDPSVMVSGS